MLKATWNTARDAWEIPDTEGLLCEHSDVFSATWPRSGSMRNGSVSERSTWARHTDANECSSSPGQLLETPRASDASGGKHNSPGHSKSLPGTVRELYFQPR